MEGSDDARLEDESGSEGIARGGGPTRAVA